MKLHTAALVLGGLLTTSCAEVTQSLKTVNEGLASVNNTAALATTPGLSSAQNESKAAMDKAAANSTGELQVELTAASSVIQNIASTAACEKTHGFTKIRRYAIAGGGALCGYASVPVIAMRNHDKNQCVSVQRIGDFNLEAKNVMKFSVLFVSNISGETHNNSFVLKKDQGEWLLSECKV